MSQTKVFDKAYFDRWYRDPRARISGPGELERKVALAVGATEYLLERKIRTVLDVGCGEARWAPILAKLRPGVRYQGVDRSPYVVHRFGPTRNVVLGGVDQLEAIGIKGPFDLIVCSDVLHYVPDDEVWHGLRQMGALLGGLAFLEAFTSDDLFIGDLEGFWPRPARWYRQAAHAAGLTPLGLHLYVGRGLVERVTALERADGRKPRAARAGKPA